MWTHRTIIVPASIVEPARAACAGLAGPGGSGMFTTTLSPTGEAPRKLPPQLSADML